MIVRSTVTVVVRQRRRDGDGWARDSRGNAVFDETRVPVAGCSVQPTSSTESRVDGRDQVDSTLTIYGPASWPGDVTSAVEIGGVRYETVGEPQRWVTRLLSHTVITVRRQDG